MFALDISVLLSITTTGFRFLEPQHRKAIYTNPQKRWTAEFQALEGVIGKKVSNSLELEEARTEQPSRVWEARQLTGT
jgi:hypothetical protein